MNKPENQKVKQEVIREIRQKAQDALKLCDEAERGNISAEEFERRVTKARTKQTGKP